MRDLKHGVIAKWTQDHTAHKQWKWHSHTGWQSGSSGHAPNHFSLLLLFCTHSITLTHPCINFSCWSGWNRDSMKDAFTFDSPRETSQVAQGKGSAAHGCRLSALCHLHELEHASMPLSHITWEGVGKAHLQFSRLTNYLFSRVWEALLGTEPGLPTC